MLFWKCGTPGSCLECLGLKAACEAVKEGKLVVYPTDTLYGLGADPFDPSAIKKVFEIKNRPGGVPLPVAVADTEEVERVAVPGEWALRVMKALEGKPLMFLLPRHPELLAEITAGSGLIGVRVLSRGCVSYIARECGPVTTTSANSHSSPEPVEAAEAWEQLGDAVEVYLDCGPTELGKPSTIIDLSGGRSMVKIIREGAILGSEVLEIVSGVPDD